MRDWYPIRFVVETVFYGGVNFSARKEEDGGESRLRGWNKTVLRSDDHRVMNVQTDGQAERDSVCLRDSRRYHRVSM